MKITLIDTHMDNDNVIYTYLSNDFTNYIDEHNIFDEVNTYMPPNFQLKRSADRISFLKNIIEVTLPNNSNSVTKNNQIIKPKIKQIMEFVCR